MFFPPPRLNLAAARSEKRDDARWLDDLPLPGATWWWP